MSKIVDYALYISWTGKTHHVYVTEWYYTWHSQRTQITLTLNYN